MAHIGPNEKLRLLTSFKCANAKREHQNIIIPMWLDMEVVQKMLNVMSLRQVTHSVLNMPILRNVLFWTF